MRPATAAVLLALAQVGNCAKPAAPPPPPTAEQEAEQDAEGEPP